MRNENLVLAAIALFASACSSGGGDTTSSSSSSSGTMNPADEVRLETTTYTVKPNEEIRYFCYTATLPADVETIAEEITPEYGKATHHVAIYQTIAKEPDGAFMCPELIKTTWLPIYVGGVASGSLKMPDGAGIKFNKGQQILIQLHLLNAGNADVTDKAAVVFKKAASSNVMPAGLFGLDNRKIKLPPASSDVKVAMDCTIPHDMDVFAVLGHMHQLGKTLNVTRGATNEPMYSEVWNFNDQPTVPKSFSLKKGDTLHLGCSYDNPGAKEVDYGESSLTEMCAFVLYHTPFEGLNGCISQ